MDDNGVAQPEEWFGLNPADGEDSAEEIDSSDEGEEEEEEGEDAEPTGGAAGQPQPDRTSSTTSRASASPAVGGDQAETREAATPSAGEAAFTNQLGLCIAP